MLWKVQGKEIVKLPETTLEDEEALERDLEGWVKSDPELLDETLLIIGQQVSVESVHDALDLLAVDTSGRPVIIEIKRGKVKDSADFQALKYASYISGWNYESFETQAKKFYDLPEHQELLKQALRSDEAEFTNLTQILDEFCDEDTELNLDQRMVLVGRGIDEKTTSVLAWLREKGVDIKFVDVRLVKDEDGVYLVPRVVVRVVVPPPTLEKVGTGPLRAEDPWKKDGRGWHRGTRCSPQSAQLLENLVELFEDLEHVEDVSWNQKHYVAIRVGHRNWASIGTHVNFHNVSVLTPHESYKPGDISSRVDLPGEEVSIETRKAWDKVWLKIRVGIDFSRRGMLDWLKEASDAYLSRQSQAHDAAGLVPTELVEPL